MSTATSFDLSNMPQSSPKKVTTPKKNIATRKSCKVSLNYRDKGVKVWVPKESSSNQDSLSIESFENVKVSIFFKWLRHMIMYQLEVTHQPDTPKQRLEEVEGNKENQVDIFVGDCWNYKQHTSCHSLSFSFSKYKDHCHKEPYRSRHSSSSSPESQPQLKKKKKRNSLGHQQIKRVKTQELLSEEKLDFSQPDIAIEPQESSSQEDLTLHFPILDFHTLKWEALSIELIPGLTNFPVKFWLEGKLYFSDFDLTSFSFSSTDVEFISLSSEDLRNNTWRTTSYFGPLSFCQIMLWKDNFMRVVESQSRVCFFLETPLESLLEPEDNHRRNEVLANAVLLMSSCMVSLYTFLLFIVE